LDTDNTKPEEKDTSNSMNECFLKLFMHNQSRIYGFIRSLVPGRSDSDDLMQETVMIMWNKFDEFEPGTDFSAWGIQISRYRIMKYREKLKSKRLRFSGDAFEEIVSRNGSTLEKMDERLKALELCIAKLNQRDSDLIQKRYDDGITTKELARRVGRPIHGMYKSMARIHGILHQCVIRTMAAWELT